MAGWLATFPQAHGAKDGAQSVATLLKFEEGAAPQSLSDGGSAEASLELQVDGHPIPLTPAQVKAASIIVDGDTILTGIS